MGPLSAVLFLLLLLSLCLLARSSCSGCSGGSPSGRIHGRGHRPISLRLLATHGGRRLLTAARAVGVTVGGGGGRRGRRGCGWRGKRDRRGGRGRTSSPRRGEAMRPRQTSAQSSSTRGLRPSSSALSGTSLGRCASKPGKKRRPRTGTGESTIRGASEREPTG